MPEAPRAAGSLARPPHEAMEPGDGSSVTSAAALKVLVVDDVVDLRRVVRMVLEQYPGLVVAGEAADGEEAIDAAAVVDPDIILLDLDMPRLNGLDALPRLRAVAPRARVVVLSGLERRTAEDAARAGGAVGFIQKGIPSRQLVDELIAITGLMEAVEHSLAEGRLALEPTSTSPSVARRFVQETLGRWNCPDLLDTVELLVSELVTNSYLHAGTNAHIAVILHRDSVRVEVADASAAPPEPRNPAAVERSGRGLQLVNKLTSAWGVDPLPEGGKVVWFEVARFDPAAMPFIIE
ncbi:MAG: response regulator receiver [Acidimicrobiia bacterium]|nr:response regulator receiver [Acidimicrobiia bacterium]